MHENGFGKTGETGGGGGLDLEFSWELGYVMNFKAVLQHLQKGTSPLIHYHKVVLLRRVCHASRALFFSFFFFVFCLFFFMRKRIF